MLAHLRDANAKIGTVELLLSEAGSVYRELAGMARDDAPPQFVGGFSELRDHLDTNILADGMLGGRRIVGGTPDIEEARCGMIGSVHDIVDA